MQLFWHLIALFLASHPRLVGWLIQRAQRTPYTHIPSRDGRQTYMRRWWLFNPYGKDAEGNEIPARWSWLPSVRIHHICLADEDRHMHDHPWNARTIILRGWYVEQLDGQRIMKWRTPGYTGRLLFGQYHRIHDVCDGGVWTLFITGRHRGTWGFKVNGNKVPWREYLAREQLSLKRGHALVLVGPQGCGKSSKARELAAKAGPFVEISGDDLASPADLRNALANEPATVIVEAERPLSLGAQAKLKELLTADHTIVDRKARQPRSVRTPNFIFCTGNRDFLPASDRRFHIVELPAA